MSKFLSLDWFKSRVETTIEKVVTSKLESLMEQEDHEERLSLIKSIKLVNDTLTVVLHDGSVIGKPNANKDDYDAVLDARDEESIYNIMSSAEVRHEKEQYAAECARMEALQQGIQLLDGLPDFIIDGTSVSLAGTSRTMPQLLVERFIEIVNRVKYQKGFGFTPESLQEDDEYLAHKNFFMWCCLNPRAEVANELYRFLNENSFRITKQGFFVALRNVVTLHGSPELVHFVSNTYNKVKAVWKKNPEHYSVFLKDGEYKLVHDDKLYEEKTFTSTTCQECDGDGGWDDYDGWEDGEWVDCDQCDGSGEVDAYEYTETVRVEHGQFIGRLLELYLDLPNREENRFTDDWTKTFDIRIGQLTSMPMEECNWSTQDCAAAGLHFTADQIHYVGCGDQSVLVLINPMKVVGIGQHKGRCYEYLPIMTVPREEATRILHDGQFDTLQLDEQYAISELESLAEKALAGFAAETKKYEFNMPTISSKEIEAIVLSLSEMKEKISSRVTTID
jgi:hypothetical protein